MASINISSFAGAGAQFFTNNGDPLVGGLLYVYTAGTTTPATTYTDPSGTTNNTNPIVLNAGGRTPYQIWVNGGVLYKFILKDSAGVLIGIYDNIPAIDDPTSFNNLITVTGTNNLIGTSTPPNTTYAAGMTLSFVVANTNTGAVTIDVDGLGAKEITVQTTPLIAGQLNAGGIAAIEYDGTRFQLMNVSGATTFTTVTTTNLKVSTITDLAGGNTAQINGMTPTAQSLQGFRNRIINGGMQIDQRGGGASVTVNAGTNFYAVDRWPASGEAADGVFTVQRSSVVPAGFTNSLLVTVTTADAAIGATQRYFVEQKIEGFNVADLGFGSVNAQTVTLSFWVRSSVIGTFGGTLSNGSNRYYPFSYTINAADTFEQKTITISGDTTGTWGTSNAVGVEVLFSLGCGASLKGTGGAWTNSAFLAPTGSVNLIATSAATFYITGVQLEAGSVATPFERRDYGRELIMCQRYYQLIGSGASGTVDPSSTTAATVGFINSVVMRSSPTLALYATALRIRVAGATSFTSSGSTLLDGLADATGGFARFGGFTGLTAGYQVTTIPTAYAFTLSAEL
jgi:hypothetical protein